MPAYSDVWFQPVTRAASVTNTALGFEPLYLLAWHQSQTGPEGMSCAWAAQPPPPPPLPPPQRPPAATDIHDFIDIQHALQSAEWEWDFSAHALLKPLGDRS